MNFFKTFVTVRFLTLLTVFERFMQTLRLASITRRINMFSIYMVNINISQFLRKLASIGMQLAGTALALELKTARIDIKGISRIMA